MYQFPCNEVNARSRRGRGRKKMTSAARKLKYGFLTAAAIIASLSVVCCRETSLEILRPPSKVIPAKGSGGAAGGPPGPECTNLTAVDQACSSASECCSGLCALDSLSKST